MLSLCLAPNAALIIIVLLAFGILTAYELIWNWLSARLNVEYRQSCVELYIV
jgi:hypothetical protein